MALPVPLSHTVHPEHFPVTNKTIMKMVKSLLLQPAVGEQPQGHWLGHISVSSSSPSSLRWAWSFLLLPRSSDERMTLHFSSSMCCKNVSNPSRQPAIQARGLQPEARVG